MGMCVCGGAMLQCTFGMAPSMLNVLPDKKTVNNMPVATIDCNKPMVNILPFGTCSAPTNPAVIAALGSPVPCVPLIPAPWVPGSPTVLVGGQPALNQTSKLMCAYAGVISVTNPGCTNIQIP
ncbi:MAG: DUF4280 domain-containing protein [Eubacterium sp.]|nr:DUF4280 domain-containing protein [Eubacterium sp.]MBQ7201396.1 DUF4280 domain-containing protein [Eubacterium sp.]MBR0120085.1 DUF4280 domain-containing protein [Eubacterium sp.]